MNTKWIPLEDIYELQWKKTLKELSFDEDNGEYMTESTLEAIDFDRVARHYEKKWKLHGDRPSSSDALISYEKQLVMVEFKNGKLGTPDIRKVRKKIRDSILVFCDVTDSNMRYTRERMEFILVYNKEKTSKEKMKEHFSKKAGKELVLFGLGIYEGSHFLKVRTLTTREFQKYLSQSLGVKKVDCLEEKAVTKIDKKVDRKEDNT